MALCWCITGISGTEKAVLMSLADQADETGLCWPSIALTAERTCFTDRAVQKAIQALAAKAVLSVQVSPGGKSNKYTINPEPRSPLATTDNASDSEPHSPFNGEPRSPRTTFTPNHVHRNGEPRSPNGEPRSPKPSRTIKEPKGISIRPDDVDAALWSEWTTHRKAKRATVTDGVLKSLRTEAEKLNWSLSQAMRKQLDRGWTGFEAEWMANDRKARENKFSGNARGATAFAKPTKTTDYTAGVNADGYIN
jgi:hypothetical protein